MGERRHAHEDPVQTRPDQASAALAASTVFAQPLRAAPPEPTAITPALIEAARKEGKVSFYSALELNVAERLGKAFEAKYPGIAVRVERSGAERIFQRIAQEQGSRINAVDVANSTDPAHYLDWKKNDWLAPFMTEDMAKHYPPEHVEADGLYATVCAWLGVIGYNTNLVKREDAPKSYADLLDPKWEGKIVKAHPGYSGAILTATFVLARDLGWGSSRSSPSRRSCRCSRRPTRRRRSTLGERAVMADGNDYNLVLLKDQGQPVEIGLPDRGHAADHRQMRHLPQRAQSQRGAPVPELHVRRRGAADLRRQFRAPFVPRAGQGEGRPNAAVGDQAAQSRPGRRDHAERGDQGALHQDFRGVTAGADAADGNLLNGATT